MNQLLNALIVCLGVLLTLIGDVYLKKSGLQDSRLLLVGIAFYAVGVIPVAVAFTRIDFGAVFLIWEALTVVLALVVAKVLFGEPLTASKAAALALAVAALYLSMR